MINSIVLLFLCSILCMVFLVVVDGVLLSMFLLIFLFLCIVCMCVVVFSDDFLFSMLGSCILVCNIFVLILLL